MRFHCGFSFRLSSLKKFLIPIALGVLAYFGLGGLFGCIKVNADENFNSYYELNIMPFDTSASFNNSTYADTFNDLILLESNYYNLIISYVDNGVSLYVISNSYNNLPINIYGSGNTLSIESSDSFYKYYFSSNSSLDSNNSVYVNFLSCYQDNIDCGNYISIGNSWTQPDIFNLYDYYWEDFTDNGSYQFTLDDWIYYTSVPLIYSPDDFNGDSETFVKSILIDDNSISPDDELLTYMDLHDIPLPDNPDNPDNPESDSIIDYIYWFTGDNLTEYDVLLNIYVLLFLYCISMIVLKLLMIVKGVKW